MHLNTKKVDPPPLSCILRFLSTPHQEFWQKFELSPPPGFQLCAPMILIYNASLFLLFTFHNNYFIIKILFYY